MMLSDPGEIRTCIFLPLYLAYDSTFCLLFSTFSCNGKVSTVNKEKQKRLDSNERKTLRLDRYFITIIFQKLQSPTGKETKTYIQKDLADLIPIKIIPYTKNSKQYKNYKKEEQHKRLDKALTPPHSPRRKKNDTRTKLAKIW